MVLNWIYIYIWHICVCTVKGCVLGLHIVNLFLCDAPILASYLATQCIVAIEWGRPAQYAGGEYNLIFDPRASSLSPAQSLADVVNISSLNVPWPNTARAAGTQTPIRQTNDSLLTWRVRDIFPYGNLTPREPLSCYKPLKAAIFLLQYWSHAGGSEMHASVMSWLLKPTDTILVQIVGLCSWTFITRLLWRDFQTTIVLPIYLNLYQATNICTSPISASTYMAPQIG